MVSLSVAIATYNEEKNIETALVSVAGWSSETVLVDGGSTDRTVAIAKQHGAKVIQTDNPPIFHVNKQKALDECTSDWILQLDADEIVSKELQDEIIQKVNNPGADGYAIPRKNYFLGHWLSKGGQYPDYVIRLFKNGQGSFPSKSVHEQISITGVVKYLQNPLIHNTNPTLADYWRKADTYTTLTAHEFRMKKNIFNFILYIFIKPLVTFFLIFFRHKGFVDGPWGFLFALFSGLHHATAYWKYLFPH